MGTNQHDSCLLLIVGAVLTCGLLAVDLAHGKIDFFVLGVSLSLVVAAFLFNLF